MNFRSVFAKIKYLANIKEVINENSYLKDCLKKNQELKDIHTGKRCFLVGNGPSINTQDITLLKNEVTIVASSFFRHPQANIVNPSYWVFADPHFWTDPVHYFIPAYKHALEKEISTKLFVPFDGHKYFDSFDRGPRIDLHYYKYYYSRGITTEIDFSRRIPAFGQNTMTVCLMLALSLGCNPIYFIGCDRDYWNMTEEEYKTYLIPHFYEEPNQHTFGNHITWDAWLAAKARTEYEYEQLKLYANHRGIQIYNATSGGLFDQFPRVDYESIFHN